MDKMEESPGKDLHNNSITEDWNISLFAYSEFEIQEELVDTGIEMEPKPVTVQSTVIEIEDDGLEEMESKDIVIEAKSEVTVQSHTEVDVQKTVLENVSESDIGPKATFRLSKVINTVIETEVTGCRLKDEPEDCVMEEIQEESVDTGVDMEPKPVIVHATVIEIEDDGLEVMESKDIGIESKDIVIESKEIDTEDLEIEPKSEKTVQSDTEIDLLTKQREVEEDLQKTELENIDERDIGPKTIFRDIEDSACSSDYVSNLKVVNKVNISEDKELKRAYYEDCIRGYVPENPAYLEERKKPRSRAITRKNVEKCDANKTMIQAILNNGPRVILEDIAIKNTMRNSNCKKIVCSHCYQIFSTRQKLRDHIYLVVLGKDEEEYKSIDISTDKLLKIPVVVLEDIIHVFPMLTKALKALSCKAKRRRKQGHAWFKTKRKWNPESQRSKKIIDPTVNSAAENGLVNRYICPVSESRREIDNDPVVKEIQTNVELKGQVKKSSLSCVHCDYEFNSKEGLRLHVYDVVLGLSYIESDWKKVFGFGQCNSSD